MQLHGFVVTAWPFAPGLERGGGDGGSAREPRSAAARPAAAPAFAARAAAALAAAGRTTTRTGFEAGLSRGCCDFITPRDPICGIVYVAAHGIVFPAIRPTATRLGVPGAPWWARGVPGGRMECTTPPTALVGAVLEYCAAPFPRFTARRAAACGDAAPYGEPGITALAGACGRSFERRQLGSGAFWSQPWKSLVSVPIPRGPVM